MDDLIEYRDGLPVEVVKMRDFDEELAWQETPR